jgi:DNA primase
LALDADEAGQSAKAKMKNTLEKFGVSNIKHVVPPEKFKDWNKFYTELDVKILKAYIDYNTVLLESENPYGL